MKIHTKAPVRIDFSGGTTDIYPFTKLGGAVLNASINRYVYGSITKKPNKTILEYHADIPTSSGLGTSGVMNVVWLALTTNFKDKIKIAELAYDIERATGVVGGKQDQYAAVLGGINFLEFKNKKVKINRLRLSKQLISKLEDRLFLYYTGPRLSSKFNQLVLNRILKKERNTTNILKKIVQNTKDMHQALIKKDLNTFADLLNQEWIYRKKLHPKITTTKIEKIIAFAKENGALAAKVCGAGGGGCILFYATNKNKLIKKFNNEVIKFKFDFEGLKTKRVS